MSQQREITEVYKLANQMLSEHGLIEKGWKFELSSQKMRVGECNYRHKLIRFSIHYLFRTPEHEIRDTILHEIAHALVGSGHGHDYVWQMKAMSIGARPDRCASHEAQSTASPNYYIECDNCKKRYPRYRLKRSLANHISTCCNAKLNFYKVQK